MSKKKTTYIFFSIAIVALIVFIFKTKRIRDLSDVINEGRLSVLIESGMHGFTRDSTKVYGFQYELIKQFADSLEVELVVINLDNKTNGIKELKDGGCDVFVSLRPIINDSITSIVSLTPIMSTRLMLVQSKRNNSKKYIEKQYELDGDTITVLKNSPYISSLIYLSDEVSVNYTINKVSNKNLDDLIKQVDVGQIKYTVCPEYLVENFKMKYENVDFSLPLSFEYDLSWCVNKSSPLLRSRLNQFINNKIETSDFQYLFKKYFYPSDL